MTLSLPTSRIEQDVAGLPSWLTLLLAVTCGLVVANLYYAQPLAGPISAAIGLAPQASGLIVTMTQVGYGFGLLFVVPLGDLFENRALVLTMISIALIALLGAAFTTQSIAFFGCALLMGIGSVAVQILVPYAAHLAPEMLRGQVVGNIMSGLMLGIMLARPVASLIANASSWHVVFLVSAGIMALVMLTLKFALPIRKPAPGLSYRRLLLSMAQLVRDTPLLRQRAAYHACLFGGFSLFWTTVPLLLAGPFHMSQNGIALFALAGVAGAVSAPLAGRAADRGWNKLATIASFFVVAAAFLLCLFGSSGRPFALAALVVGAILLDFGVTAHLVLSQRMLFSLGAEYRARLNGLFMAAFFVGGAVGSALGGWTYAEGGWSLSMSVGVALPVLAFSYYLTED